MDLGEHACWWRRRVVAAMALPPAVRACVLVIFAGECVNKCVWCAGDRWTRYTSDHSEHIKRMELARNSVNKARQAAAAGVLGKVRPAVGGRGT